MVSNILFIANLPLRHHSLHQSSHEVLPPRLQHLVHLVNQLILLFYIQLHSRHDNPPISRRYHPVVSRVDSPQLNLRRILLLRHRFHLLLHILHLYLVRLVSRHASHLAGQAVLHLHHHQSLHLFQHRIQV